VLVRFRAEKAVCAGGEPVRWVVVDENWSLHVEASAFLASLRARDCSPNTERAYAGRVGLFLSYCSGTGVDWHCPTFLQLHAFLHWLVSEPVDWPGSQRTPRLRSKGTANAIFTTVSEFLRFGAKHGWVSAGVPAMLSEPRLLHYLPPGFDSGEDGQFRTVNVKTIKFQVGGTAPEILSVGQLEQVLARTRHARDRFLVMLLLASGMRIGEALGLWREDMHFLARSDMLGCRLTGPHLHVRRRLNANGALAKSRYPRSIPVTEDVVDAYADYQFERDRPRRLAHSDAVFVNLFRPPRGRAMGYANTKELFDRLAGQCGFPVRPHMFRHTAATRCMEAGVAPDVVQALLGHVAFASTAIYLHATQERMREAVERTAAAAGAAETR
jgi:integrase/recombinase XerD